MDNSYPPSVTNKGTISKDVGIRDLRDAIPRHCFQASYITSFSYLTRDLFGVAGLSALAMITIPGIGNHYCRITAWLSYGFVQGLFGTGLWVLAHECGHGGFSPNQKLNDLIGWILHSVLLTPYFAWKSTHKRHHIYANHMEKDHHYVPLRRDTYAAKLGISTEELSEVSADAPLVTFVRIVVQQLLGWPWYILFNITSGPESTYPKVRGRWWQNSHFDPASSLFNREEFLFIILSDIGIGLTVSVLWYLVRNFGLRTMFFIYIVPWLWVNHWIVAITFLHHTHPSVPKYENASWNFLRGATATIDRDFGYVGRFFFHNIIDFHVIHHLFSRIPFYHAEEATNAIIPLLGTQYLQDKASSFIGGLWQAFRDCQWVGPHQSEDGENQALWFRKGPSPAPEYKMRDWKNIGSTDRKVWM